MWKSVPLAILISALGLVLANSNAQARDEIVYPDKEEVEDAVPEGGKMAGHDIWEKFLENRIHSAIQHQTVISKDPGGGEQTSRFWVRWKDYRTDEGEADADGILGKTLIKFQEPTDMRHTGFLMVLYDEGRTDQFVYTASSRRVRRVNLRDAGVGGTDISFDDIAFSDIEDADYKRLEDEMIGGESVYVVEAIVKPEAPTQYSRSIAYFEKDHYVPLRVRYFDHADIEVKEMRAGADTIKEFNGVWVATESTLKNLKRATETTVLVEDIDPNLEISDNLFSTFRLALSR